MARTPQTKLGWLTAFFVDWWRGGLNNIDESSTMPSRPKLPSAIVAAAKSCVGIRETGGSNKGPDLQKFFASDWYDPNGDKPGDDGYAWCAAFVCWCVQEAMRQTGVKETATFHAPRTPGAWDFERWSLAQDSSTQTQKPHHGDIKVGDLVIFNFSHIGIAIRDAHDGIVHTVEGNTNSDGSREGDGVYEKSRALSLIRSRIRFTI